MRNFALEFEPQRWEDIYHQDLIVNRFKRWIATGEFPSSVFVLGGSGTGKTASIRLMIKATHCLQRQPGQVNPCGQCQVCRSDPMQLEEFSNVIWVDPEAKEAPGDKTITYEQQIRQALITAERGPYQTGQAHRDVLFVVFNECHLMPDNLRQRALIKSDLINPLNPNVVYVFITMEPERIRDASLQALSQRGAILRFHSPTEQQLLEYARIKLPKSPVLTETSLKILVRVARNSYRGLLNAYKECLDCDPLMSEAVVCEIYAFVNVEVRKRLWSMLRDKSSLAELKEFLDILLCRSNPLMLMTQLADDLDDQGDTIAPEDYRFASTLFLNYFQHPHLYSLRYVLNQLKGLRLVDPHKLR